MTYHLCFTINSPKIHRPLCLFLIGQIRNNGHRAILALAVTIIPNLTRPAFIYQIIGMRSWSSGSRLAHEMARVKGFETEFHTLFMNGT